MRNTKVLIIGATGMAGHMIYSYLLDTDKYEIINTVYRNKLNSESILVNVTKEIEVKNLISAKKPDIIVNCVGVLIAGSKINPANAIYINSYFPHLLSKFAREIDAKLIHISTDCVFSGNKGGYLEDDFRDADDIYGRSKAIGELNNYFDLTIRTSIIGPELKRNGEGLFHWFMHQNDKIEGYKNVYWGGVTTLELAKAVDYFITMNSTGLVNLTNGSKISKYELLQLINLHFHNDSKIITGINNLKKSDKSLKSNRTDLSFSVDSYENMIKDLKLWFDSREYLYQKYYSN